ncbi:MAG: hypothetical protein WC004_03880 [Candidatus Absconditabacterales bacterium]
MRYPILLLLLFAFASCKRNGSSEGQILNNQLFVSGAQLQLSNQPIMFQGSRFSLDEAGCLVVQNGGSTKIVINHNNDILLDGTRFPASLELVIHYDIVTCGDVVYQKTTTANGLVMYNDVASSRLYKVWLFLLVFMVVVFLLWRL